MESSVAPPDDEALDADSQLEGDEVTYLGTSLNELCDDDVKMNPTYVTFTDARPVLVVKNTVGEKGDCDPTVSCDDVSEDLCMECSDDAFVDTRTETSILATPSVRTYSQTAPTRRFTVVPKQRLVEAQKRRSSDGGVDHSESIIRCKQPKSITGDATVMPMVTNINRSTHPEVHSFHIVKKSPRHMLLILKHIGNKAVFQCTKCPHAESTLASVADHCNDTHPRLSDTETTRRSSYLFMFCRHCDFVAFDTLAMAYHFEQHHGLKNMISVKLPGPGASEPRPIERHQLQTETVVYSCCACDFLGVSARDVVRHATGQHAADAKTRTCVANGCVQMHRLVASDEPPQQQNGADPSKVWLMNDYFACMQCSHGTDDQVQMWVHRITTHANLSLVFVCSLCNMFCRKPDAVVRHFQTAHASAARQCCSVTLVDGDGREDSVLSGQAREARLATSEPPSPRSLIRRPGPVASTTTTLGCWSTLVEPKKSKPIAVVTGSCSSTTPAQKAQPMVLLLKPMFSTSVQEQRGTTGVLALRSTQSLVSTCSVVPLQPSQPQQSVQQPKPVQPIQQATHVQSIQQLKHVQLIQQPKPVQPIQQSKPVQIIQVSKPVQIIQQSKYVQLIQQSKPVQIIQQSKYVQLIQQSKPVQPVLQTKPVQPILQSKPAQPKLVQPIHQSKLVQPIQQSKPVQPIKQLKPAQSILQPKPAQTILQPKPAQPLLQSKPLQPIQQPKPVQLPHPRSILIPKPTQSIQQPIHVQSIQQPKPVQSIQQPKHVQPIQQPQHPKSTQQQYHVQSIQQPKPVEPTQRPHPVLLTRVPTNPQRRSPTVYQNSSVATHVKIDPTNNHTKTPQLNAKRAKQSSDTRPAGDTHVDGDQEDTPVTCSSPRQLTSGPELEDASGRGQPAVGQEEARYVKLPDGSVQLELVWYEPA